MGCCRRDGVGSESADIFARSFEVVGYLIFVNTLLLVARGWTITTTKLSRKAENLFFTAVRLAPAPVDLLPHINASAFARVPVCPLPSAVCCLVPSSELLRLSLPCFPSSLSSYIP